MKSMLCKANHSENDRCHFKSVTMPCLTKFREAKGYYPVKSLVISKCWKKPSRTQQDRSTNHTVEPQGNLPTSFQLENIPPFERVALLHGIYP